MTKLLGGLMLTLASVASASAAPAGNVPAATLAKLGLSQMQRVSDSDGLKIRGKGTVVAFNIAIVHNAVNTHVSQTIIVGH